MLSSLQDSNPNRTNLQGLKPLAKGYHPYGIKAYFTTHLLKLDKA